MNEEELIDAKKYLRCSYRFRGVVISHTSTLESVVEDFISGYFFREHSQKRLSFLNLLNKKLKSFDMKVEMFEDLIKENLLLEEGQLKILKDKITFVSRHRNILAHWLLSSEPEDFMLFDEAKPILTFFKLNKNAKVGAVDAIDFEIFSEERIDSIINESLFCINMIEDLRKSLGF